jgi:hypothetical protein
MRHPWGRMPAWQLYKMLDGLQPYSDEKTSAVEPTPSLLVDASLIDEAKELVEAAHPNPKAMFAIQQRISAAGFDVEAGWWADRRHLLAQWLACTLACERGIVP